MIEMKRETWTTETRLKESISAIESYGKITGNDKRNLGACLKAIGKRIYTLCNKGAFSQLYGYTSDQGGIRHALTEKM